MLKALFLMSALFFSTASHASLIDRGNGMIYDTATNLTWLQDANYARTSGYDADGLMTWDEAMQWAENLVFGGFDDWRLPISRPVNGITFDVSGLTYSGSIDVGYNIDSQYSEFASLFNALDAIPAFDIFGYNNWPYGISSDQPIVNVLPWDAYFTGTRVILPDSGSPNGVFIFGLNNGMQHVSWRNSLRAALAVREGDVLPPTSPIPEPYTPLLMGIGLIVLFIVCKAKPQPADAFMLLA